MSSNKGKYLNQENIIQKVFDETTDSLRTTSGGGTTTVIIDSLSDSIAIGDSVTGVKAVVDIDGLKVNATGSVVKIDPASLTATDAILSSIDSKVLTNAQLRASPIPVSVDGAVFNITGGLRVDLDGFDATNPDSVQIVGSSDGTATGTKRGVIVTAAKAMSVDGSATTQPISASSLPLPSGASTSALQSTANISLSSIDSKLTSPLNVIGPLTNTQLRATPVPISGTVTATISGVSTLAEQQTQTSLLTSIDGKLTNPITIQATNLDIRDLVFSMDKVDVSGSSVSITAASLPLPIGASTSALQTSGNASLTSIDTKLTSPLTITGSIVANIGTTNGLALDATVNSLLKPTSTLAAVTAITNTVTIKADTALNQLNALKIDGSATTQPISATTLPLPVGAATSALQTNGNQKTQIVDGSGNVISSTSNALDVNLKSGITVDVQLSQANDSVLVYGFDGTSNQKINTNASGILNTNTNITNASLAITAVSLPLPSGAATSALQTIANTSLASIDSKLTSPITVTGSITATNSANGNTGAAVPIQATQIAGSDGTNLRALKVSNTGVLSIDGSATTQPISGSVSISNFPASQNVVVTSSVLPTGASTSALQTTGNTSLASIDTKTPALGQALATASVPVVLTASQLTTLTPVSTVTANIGTTNGLALDATLTGGTQKAIVRSATKGTTAAADVTSTNVDANTQALDVSIKGTVTTSISGTPNVNVTNASIPVTGTFFQATQPISATSLPLPTGAATETTLSALNTKVTAVNTGAVTISTALPAGTNSIGQITANAGTNLNTSLLALDSTVAKDASLTTLNTSVNTLLKPASTLAKVTTVDTITNTVVVRADVLANQTDPLKVSATSLPLPSGAATEATLSSLNSKVTAVNTGAVTISTALPTGTNSVGQVTANAGTNLNTSALNLETTQSAINTKIPSGLTVAATRLLIDGSGVTQPISAAALPLPTGASTSALQTTGNTSLASIDTKLTGVTVAQASTTSSQTGQLIMGAVTTAAPTYVTAQTNPLSLTTAGELRISNATDTNGTQKTQIVDSTGAVIDSIPNAGVDNLLVALGATNYALSTVNTSVAQLASGASFTGGIENTFNQQSYSILITTDQTGTLTINQYIDAAGTFLAQSSVFSITGGSSFARSGVVNGNFFNLKFTNNGGATTTTLNINTAYGTIPSTTQLNNSPCAINEVGGTAITLGQKTPTLSFPVIQSSVSSYSASILGLNAANSATDIFTITGSATTTIKIIKIGISGTTTSGTRSDIQLIRRSTANSAGTSSTPTIVLNDTANAAATAVVRAYTANPTLGTTVGTLRTTKIDLPTTATTNGITPFEWIFGGNNSAQPITLRGTSQVLAINLNAITITGNSFDIYIEFTEE